MQYAGGILLPPVQKLVATLIFAKGKNANESPAGHHRVSEDPAGHHRVSEDPAGHHRVSEDPAGHHRVSEDPAGHQRKAKTQRVTLCLWQSKRRIPSLCKEPVGQRWVFFRLRKKMQTTVAVPDIFVGFEKPSSSVDRGHSLTSLYPPLAALGSLPPAGHLRVSEDPAGHQRKAKTQRVTIARRRPSGSPSQGEDPAGHALPLAKQTQDTFSM